MLTPESDFHAPGRGSKLGTGEQHQQRAQKILKLAAERYPRAERTQGPRSTILIKP